MTRDQRLTLVVAVLASFVAFLDGSVINVALPAIGAELGGGLTTQQWVVDAYLITLASLILVAGSLSDVYGRVLILRWGLVGFAVTSVFCAVAPTAEMLIVGRGLQGIAGALLVPSSLALILSAFRGAAQAKAIGTWTAWTSAAFIAGPILGGLFVDYLSWRLVFGINVIPIGVTLVLLGMLEHRDSRDRSTSVDLIGAVLGVIGIGAPVFALIEQANFGWASPVIILPALLGAMAFAAFLWRQRVARHPMMPLSLFGVRNFAVGNLATLLIYAALSLGGFIVAVFLQQSAGYSATFAGAAFVPVTFLNIGLSTLFGSLAGRFGPRLFMSVGPMVAGVGYLLMLSIDVDAPYLTTVLPGVLVFGLGLSITVAPLTAAILGAVDGRQAGIGSAVNNAVSRVAGLLSVALVGVIVGTQLDVEGLHRGLVTTAVLLFIGGGISALGIRNPRVSEPPVSTAAIPLPEHPQR